MASAQKISDPLEPLREALAPTAAKAAKAEKGAKPEAAPPGPPALPLVYLCGDEKFLIDRALELIKSAMLVPATRDWNYETLHGKEATSARILATARTLPMMAPRRLVVVRDADTLSADELGQLSSYLQNPAPETCLCMIAEKADLRLKFFTLWKKHGLLLKLDLLNERQLPGFVEAESKRLKVILEPGVAARIAEEIGSDLGQLASALERLACYVPPGSPIRLADVDEVVATTRQHSVFELVDAVGASDRAEALRLISGMMALREPALRLLALLGRHVRQLWQTVDLMARGTRGAGELASALGVPPFVATKLQEQARKLNPRRVGRMHEAIYQTDRSLKLSKLDDERLMEQLILRLCTT
jgi:DNA polymerase-3 subunit delta